MAWEWTPWRPFRELTPLRDFERMRREMDHLLDCFFEKRPRRGEEEMVWLPALDLAETNNEIVVKAEVPGMDPKDIDVSLYDGTLTIKGEKKQEKEEKEEGSGWSQAPDDGAAEMYLEGLARLEAAGLAQYEISNVARPGHQARHNLKYWQAGDWFGFGCGAHSTVDGRRWKNVSDTAEYVARVEAGQPVSNETETLSARERLEEALFTGMPLNAGIDRPGFQARFGVDPWDRYGRDLDPFVQTGQVWHESGRFGLTLEGMLLANEILAIFV